MIIHKEMRDRWQKYATLIMREHGVAVEQVNTPSLAWIVARKISIPDEAYHIGANDKNIEAVLRRIFPHAWPD